MLATRAAPHAKLLPAPGRELDLPDSALFDPTMKPKRSFLNAVKWAYSANWGDRAFSALFTFILAAILGPRDFGLVSIGLIYLSFMQMFLDQGLVAALIQRPELKRQHCDSVFWINLFLSLLLVGLTVLLSGWWARINHAPDLAQLLSVMSLSIP